MNNKLSTTLLSLPRSTKRLLALALDAFLCGLTVWMALCLRLDGWVELEGAHWWAVALSLTIALPVFVSMGLYRAIFRYAGSTAMVTVVKAAVIYGAFYSAAITALALPGVPRAVGFLQPALLLLMVGASRAVARFVLSGVYLSKLKLKQANLPKVLIYGAGSAGHQLATAISNSFEMRAVGFLDDDARLHGQDLNGLRIYDPKQLASCVEQLQASHVLLAIPSVSRTRRNEILELTRRARVSVRTLPSLMEMANGLVRASDLRELDIEDLLGRDAVPPNVDLLGRNIRDKVVLVTGAGGSIGSELCRQIVKLSPKRLLLIESSEFALYAVHQELTQLLVANNSHRIELIPLLATVLDADRMDSILRAWHPHTIYHAAAYKHLPMVEHNPIEGIKNNVLGTLTLARAAAACGVSDFVLISTDKAVRPTNVMGASKRLAELVLQALAGSVPGSMPGSMIRHAAKPLQTRFSMVRFGNVLGSSGSVVPLFRRQIKSGGPLTLTHPGITRYFMTLAEASQLVIQAGAMAKGGDVFVLDMGEPIRILDLAKSMVELSGLSVRDEANPGGDIEIQITGLRPGEKLYEELLIGDNPLPSSHPRIMTARDPFLPLPELLPRLEALKRALDAGDVVKVRNQLQALVPGYQPEGVVVDWVHLANAALSADIAHLVHEVSLPQTAESANEARLKRSRKPASANARPEKLDEISVKRAGQG
jgi:FlaA1/EpsC-like NDP-sugar epimerase